MQNLSRNELEQIAKMRHMKIYKNISKKGLLIAPLKRFLICQGTSFRKQKKKKKIFHKIRKNINLSRLKKEENEKYLTEL